MNRRDFLKSGAVVGVAAACMSARAEKCCGDGMPKLAAPAKPAQLNLCLQWGLIPAKDDINAKLDYLEANDFQAVEIPSHIGWVRNNGMKLVEALKGRKLFLSTACGPSRFDHADKSKNDAEVERFLPLLELLGQMKSVGLIICPARSKPEVGLKELREDFVANTGKRLAQKAAECGTSIVLEPLQRRETPFLRQVADGAKIAQEIGAGCTVMGDFWHMSKEETSFMGAFISAGSLLSHVHVASLGNRRIPGTDGDKDNYVDGFKGLKLIGYRGAVSFECGFPPKGKDSRGKPIMPNQAERHELIVKAVKMLRKQWAEA